MLNSAHNACKNITAVAHAIASCKGHLKLEHLRFNYLLTDRETEAQRGTGMSFQANAKGVAEPGLEYNFLIKLSFYTVITRI